MWFCTFAERENNKRKIFNELADLHPVERIVFLAEMPDEISSIMTSPENIPIRPTVELIVPLTFTVKDQIGGEKFKRIVDWNSEKALGIIIEKMKAEYGEDVTEKANFEIMGSKFVRKNTITINKKGRGREILAILRSPPRKVEIINR